MRLTNFINGQQVEPLGGAWLDDVEPATGQAFAQIADSDERDVNLAADAAEAAFQGWSRTPAAERSRRLLALAEAIEKRLEEFAQAESRDAGKPIGLARSLDIPRAVANFRFFATAILHEETQAQVLDEKAVSLTLRQPRGVAGCISPWNLPLYLLSWKTAPALAAGCPVVAKPSEMTPLTAHLLGQAANDAGLPPGVLNIVHGLGPKAGAAIVSHPRIPSITFTGGTQTGQWIAATAAPMFKRLSLELGGKNANVIFDDADLSQAIPTSVRAAFTNTGQICLCGSRILVHRSVIDEFIRGFVEQTRKLVVGDPADERTNLGPVISAAHLAKVRSYIELARKEGGTILSGGDSPASDQLPARCRGGFFLNPTIITGLKHDCRVHMEEIFGPVVTIQTFDNEQQAIELANCTRYGLAASIWTRDVQRAHRVAAAVHAGIVWVNCWLVRDLRVPFGGMKASGVGREGGLEALHFFSEAKSVCFSTG